jgi:hypothetical protein
MRTWLLYSKIAVSRKPFGIGHMYIYSFFSLEWPILIPPRILTFPSGALCICTDVLFIMYVRLSVRKES